MAAIKPNRSFLDNIETVGMNTCNCQTDNLQKLVAVLYARRDSVYKKKTIADVFDIDRDARTYSGTMPVVTHPPCRAWGRLKCFAKPRPDERDLAFHAIDQVRRCGGVLEHPHGSELFGKYLPLPGRVDEFGGFTISINQHWFGHKAEKKTFIYICGCRPAELPEYPVIFDAVEYVVNSRIRKSSGRLVKREITKKEREETPERLADWLIEIALICKK